MAFLRGRLGKTFSAVLAFKWLFTCVDPFMRRKVPGLSELFRAEPTLERFLASMNPHMNLKIGKKLIYGTEYILSWTNPLVSV